MDFSAKTLNLTRQPSPCIVAGVFDAGKPVLSPSARALDQATGKQLSKLLARDDLSGKPGSILMVHEPREINAKRILLLGLGKKGEVTSQIMRQVVVAAVRQLDNGNIKTADLALLDTVSDDADVTRQVRSMVEAIDASLYRYDKTKSVKNKARALKKVNIIADRAALAAAKQGVVEGTALANGVRYCRTISDLPGNICTPGYLARQAKALQKTHEIKTTVLDEAQMKRLKMGSLLSVSRGSREPAKLIVMEYRGGDSEDNPVVLIGKGLTFDAGGISIKPAGAMDEMKYDMCGGASVFGALIAVSEMELPINVVGIVPSSENLPDGAANKPGDIVTSMSGTTIEILNTDAEGRLILCDAMTYAQRYKPAAVVDIATLTGACIIALGHHASGLFSNSDPLAEQLLRAGEDAGDRAWQLPLWEDYSKQLQSNFADLANIGGRSAGSVTAACFLKHFAGKYDWAHLDVAGTAWKSADPKGATGRPVPLLVEFLMARARQRKDGTAGP